MPHEIADPPWCHSFCPKCPSPRKAVLVKGKRRLTASLFSHDGGETLGSSILLGLYSHQCLSLGSNMSDRCKRVRRDAMLGVPPSKSSCCSGIFCQFTLTCDNRLVFAPLIHSAPAARQRRTPAQNMTSEGAEINCVPAHNRPSLCAFPLTTGMRAAPHREHFQIVQSACHLR